jgi:predicted aspartyl protease
MTFFVRRIFLVAMAGLALFLASCATSGSDGFSFTPKNTILAADRVSLDSRRDQDGYLYVDVRINGKGPFTLLVDTGCSTTFLTQSVADAAGVKPLPNSVIIVVNAAGNKSEQKLGWIDKLECGGLTLEQFGVGIGADAELAAFGAIAGRTFQGAIGMAMLKDVVVELDFPGKQVNVIKPGTNLYPSDRAVPYEETIPVVAMNVGGKEFKVALDSGYNGELEIPTFDGVPLTGPKSKGIGMGAVFGQGNGKRHATGQLAGEARLGPIVWANPPMSEVEQANERGLVGVGLFDQWKLAIDQHAHQLYFLGDKARRGWDEKKPRDQRFSAGFFAELENDALRLIEVDTGSAADLAGLRAGDLVLSVDGKSPVRWEASGYRAKLRVQRGGAEFETTFISAPDYSPRQTLLAADRVALSTSSARGVLIVEARINGAGPFRFIVNTGESALRLAPAVVEAAGLKAMPGWSTRPGAATPNVVWVERFVAGDLELKGMAAVQATAADIASAQRLFGSVDGYLGLDPFKDAVLEVDFPKKQVNVARFGTQPYDEERALAYRGSAPRVGLELPGRSLPTLLATGGSFGFELPMLDELPLIAGRIKQDEIALLPAGERSARGQLKGEAKAGPVTWVQPPLVQRKTSRIGASSLAAWRIVVDQQAHKLYFLDGALRRKASVPAGSDPRFKPGYFGRMVGEEVQLVEVDAGGAFDQAGLRVGDAIVSIEGKAPRQFFNGGQSFINWRGPPPTLHVRRNGMEFDALPVLAPSDPAEAKNPTEDSK